jgi:branched-chain amino acid transport system permease protein
MITLAFAQLLYFVGVALRQYGGDDGFTFRGRSIFPGLDLKDGVTFFYVVWGVLAVSLAIVYRIVGSRFGMALRGIRSNERRIRALGLPSYRYKLAAFVIAGTMCGIAGGLLANFAQFVSPAYMHWSVSGDLLVMVLIGGFSSVFGPVIGAIVYRLLEDILSGYTEHWQIILGPILILIVLFARKGLMGVFARRHASGAGHG